VFSPLLQLGYLMPAPHGETATQALKSLVSKRRFVGRIVVLNDGAPALAATVVGHGGAGPGGGLPDTIYHLYAEHGQWIYSIVFSTATKYFAAESPAVKKVVFNFNGTGS
jgi:hypothetical protein